MTAEYMNKALSFTELYENHLSFQQKEDTRAVLADIAADYNMYGTKAIETADEIMRAVQKYEVCYTMVQEDTCHAISSFLRSLDAYDAQTRVRILDNMVSAMTVFSDETLLKEAEAKGFEQFHREADDGYGYDDSLENEMYLRDSLMEQVQKMNLSPTALHCIIRKLKKSPNAITSYHLAQENFQLKCAAAMHIYMNNRPYLSTTEAASHACSDIYMQAAANAVYCGQIAEEFARVILIAAITAAMIFLAAYGNTLMPLPLSILGSIGIGIDVYKITAPVRYSVGKAAAGMSHALVNSRIALQKGLEQILDYIWQQCTERVRAEVEQEMMDEAIYGHCYHKTHHHETVFAD